MTHGAGTAPVAVLIATFNRAHYLADSLDGILGQTVAPAQIIVVNDGSTDDTGSVLQGFSGAVTVIDQDNRGKAAALNKAFEKVDQPYVWIFDDDDVAMPDALKRHLAALAQCPGADFTYSSWYRAKMRPDRSLEIVDLVKVPDLAPDEVFPELLQGCFMLQQGSVVSSAAFRAIGGFDATFMRSLDYEFLLRLARQYRGVAVPEPTFFFRMHEGMRGTASHQFPAAARSLRWAANDRRIIARHYRELPVLRYLPSGGETDHSVRERYRRALVRRASIVGRHGLWPEHFDDLQEILECDTARELDARERKELYGIFDNVHTVRELRGDRGARRRAKALLSTPGGRVVREIYVRRIYHLCLSRLRHREWREAILVARFLARGIWRREVMRLTVWALKENAQMLAVRFRRYFRVA